MPLAPREAPWDPVRAAGELAVVLVRHGRTAWNHEGRFLGRTDLGLDDEGRAQAAGLAQALGRPFDALYASPLARAWQTACALAPPQPVSLEGVQELDQGELEGNTIDEALARWPAFFSDWQTDPARARVPGGETLGEGRDRALEALLGVARTSPRAGVVGVVAHQLVLASVLCTVAGEPLRSWRRYGLPNGGIAVLAWDGSGLRIVQQRWSAMPAGSTATDV